MQLFCFMIVQNNYIFTDTDEAIPLSPEVWSFLRVVGSLEDVPLVTRLSWVWSGWVVIQLIWNQIRFFAIFRSNLDPRVVGPQHHKLSTDNALVYNYYFCAFIKLMEPLILIKPSSLLLKWCFYSCAGTAIIELLRLFSHRTTWVTSQPGIHIRQLPILESKVALQSSAGSQGVVTVWLVRALNCATQWQDGLRCNITYALCWLLNCLIDFLTGRML